jgi:hypothetical protein
VELEEPPEPDEPESDDEPELESEDDEDDEDDEDEPLSSRFGFEDALEPERLSVA